MSDNPTVSVIALCYNHEQFLDSCLDSIRDQTYEHIQLIITDDLSRDGSVSKIREWIRKNNHDCVFMANEINIGICKTLNKAMQHVIGDYVCIISTDDVMKTNRIARQVALFKELSQDYGVIYTDAKVIDEKGKILHNSFIEKIRVDNIKPSGDIYEYLVIQNFIPIMTTMLSRNILNKIGPFDERLIYEDWDLWLRLSIVCKFYYLDVIGANYRVLSSSLVKNMGIKGVESTFLLTLKCLSNDNNHDTRSILEGRLLAMLIMIFKGRSRMRFYAFVKAFACHRRKIFMLSYLISGNTFVNKIINCYVVKCFRRSIVKIL